MKTPEEIKKWLECCVSIRNGECEKYAACGQCPFFTTNVSDSDTLAYIKQLEAQVPKWISVEERLPENSGKYLVFTHTGSIDALYYSVKHRAFNAFDSLPVSAHPIRVRYWMPLPPVPKEG